MVNMRKLLVMLVAVLLVGCADKSAPKEKFNPVIPVKVMTVEEIDKDNYRNYIGVLKSEVEIPLSFMYGGTIVEVYTHNGQYVKKGDLLARVDDVTARSLHETALASLRQAEDGYERLKKVHDEGGISDVRWVQMLTDLEKARQAEISTRDHLEGCSLYAPQDGVVSMDNISVGTDIRPTQTFCRLVDLDKMVVTFTVPEKEIGLLSVGDKAVSKIPALNNEEYEIKVYDKSLIANPLGHTYAVRARFISEADKALLPGMIAKISMSAAATTGIIVPASCVQTVAKGVAVWVVKDGVVSRRMIEVGEFVRNGVLVKSGLDYGDVVVTEGYHKLYEGAKVSY